MPLSRRPLPFDHPEWIFELKYDGFRSLAVIQNSQAQLISRNGNPFNSFADLCKGSTVPDGEIVCLDKRGRPQFSDLLFRRGEPCFYAFDLLMCDGKDLRSERLTDRKHELRRLLTGLPTSRLRYADHVEREGIALFKHVSEMDLEGIVAKHSFAPYTTERTTWFKIKNRSYSQMQRRDELFERERHKEPVAGWHCCELACADVERSCPLIESESMVNSKRSFEISAELARLLAWQTNFLKKIEPTAAEHQEYAKSRDRVRELFHELEQLAKAA